MKSRFGFTSVFALLLFVFGVAWSTPTHAQSAPVITVAPTDISRAWGGSGALSVVATGTEPLTYQWYRGESGVTTSPVPGATGPLLVTPPLTATTLFWVQVTAGGLSADSPAATITVAGAPVQPLTLTAMGYNDYGQLGDGSFNNRSTPVPVATGVTSPASSSSHTLFIKADGSLWATGYNFNGQLGNGSTSYGISTPVQVATGVVSASAGTYHSLFIKTDGTLWAMGDNSLGQLGDGSTTSRSTPVQIATGVASVSAGGYHTRFV